MGKRLFKSQKSFLTKWVNKIKDVDMYGKNIQMTYNGNDKYRTYIGGVASIFVSLIIITYVIYLFYVMFKKQDTNVTTNSAVDDIFDKVKIHQPGLLDFDFALSFEANGIDYMQDLTAFKVEMNQVVQEWNSSSTNASFNRTKTPIDFTLCGKTNFKYGNQNEVERIGVDKYYCPNISNYTLAGTFYAKSFHYLEIKIRR